MELDRFIAYCLVDDIPVDGFLITDRVFDSYAHWSDGTNSRVWLYFKYQDNEYELEYRRYPRKIKGTGRYIFKFTYVGFRYSTFYF